MITQIILNDIENNPWQTRVGNPDPEYIKALALDIAKNGLLQIPIGRYVYHDPNPTTTTQLAFGHNRLAAYEWLYDLRNNSDIPGDFSSMPVDLRELTDQQMADYAWSENAQRRDVSAIERALAIQKRMESFGWSQAHVSEHLGVDRSTISNLLRLLKLPDDLRANISNGEISERQAMALLPLFETPEHDNFGVGYPEQIVRNAIAGESSDKLRGRVDAYFGHVSKPLEKSGIKLDEVFTEGGRIYCGTCRACDKRMGSRNLCFLPTCFEAKVKYKEREYLAKASAASGYPLSDENKGGSVSRPYSNKMDTIRKVGCQNLCLVYSGGEVALSSYKVDGYPHAELVCDKRNNSCSCEKGLNVREVLKAESRPMINIPESIEIDDNGFREKEPVVDTPVKITSSDLEEAARQARKDKRYAIEQHDKVKELLVTILAQALKDDDPGAFYVVAKHYIWPKDEDMFVEKLYGLIARDVVHLLIPVDYDSIADLVQNTNRNLARLGLPAISLEKSLAETFDVESSPETTSFQIL